MKLINIFFLIFFFLKRVNPWKWKFHFFSFSFNFQTNPCIIIPYYCLSLLIYLYLKFYFHTEGKIQHVFTLTFWMCAGFLNKTASMKIIRVAGFNCRSHYLHIIMYWGTFENWYCLSCSTDFPCTLGSLPL